MVSNLIDVAEGKHLKEDIPQFNVGDTVDVHVRIIEGEKKRVQVFNGTVISRKGSGISETFTVRRIVNNEGVERIFPVHSPSVVKVDVTRSGYIRRSKLYFLRKRTGKGVRLREMWTGRKEAESQGI
jgi:large subunit ribosomal protein L19